MSLQVIITNLLKTIVQPLIGVVIGAGFLLFFWGIAHYLFLMSGDAKNKEGAKQFMLWGVITITVMISIWGIVQLLQSIFLNGSVPSTPPTIPKFNASGGGGPTPEQCTAMPGYPGC